MISLKLFCSEEKHDVIMAMIHDHDPSGSLSNENELVVYFDKAPKEEFLHALSEQFDCNYELNQVLEKNWNEIWESNFEPVEIEDFCRIMADFHDSKSSKFEHEIRINPKMSFGTGHHETTTMMIGHMKHLKWKDKEVLDFGSGTGVLAILASQLGAKWIWANDIESNAVENAEENAEANNISNITIKHGGLEIFEGRSFDMILANINRAVLLASAGELRRALKSGGKLLISGILGQDLEMVDTHYLKNGFEQVKVAQLGEWRSVLYE